MASTFDTVAGIIAETADIPREQITPESHAIDDLGIDSLAFLDIAFAIDKAFGIKLPLEQWTQEVNEGKVPAEEYFVLQQPRLPHRRARRREERANGLSEPSGRQRVAHRRLGYSPLAIALAPMRLEYLRDDRPRRRVSTASAKRIEARCDRAAARARSSRATSRAIRSCPACS